MEWAQTEAEVVSGQQLASGTSTQDAVFAQEIMREDGARGKGTIFLQAYAFQKMGFNLEAYFGDEGYVNGTLNLLIAPVQ